MKKSAATFATLLTLMCSDATADEQLSISDVLELLSTPAQDSNMMIEAVIEATNGAAVVDIDITSPRIAHFLAGAPEVVDFIAINLLQDGIAYGGITCTWSNAPFAPSRVTDEKAYGNYMGPALIAPFQTSTQTRMNCGFGRLERTPSIAQDLDEILSWAERTISPPQMIDSLDYEQTHLSINPNLRDREQIWAIQARIGLDNPDYVALVIDTVVDMSGSTD